MNEIKTFKTAQCGPINIGDVSGSIFFYPHNARKGLIAITYMDFFSDSFCVKDDKKNGRLEFSRPILSSLKVQKATKTNKRYTFYLSNVDLEKGHYSDFEIEDESLFLYYR